MEWMTLQRWIRGNFGIFVVLCCCKNLFSKKLSNFLNAKKGQNCIERFAERYRVSSHLRLQNNPSSHSNEWLYRLAVSIFRWIQNEWNQKFVTWFHRWRLIHAQIGGFISYGIAYECDFPSFWFSHKSCSSIDASFQRKRPHIIIIIIIIIVVVYLFIQKL